MVVNKSRVFINNFLKFLVLYIMKKKFRKLFTDHMNCFRIYGLRDDSFLLRHVFDHFLEGSTLDFFPFEVGQWIRDKIEQYATLTQLLNKQLLSVGGRSI